MNSIYSNQNLSSFNIVLNSEKKVVDISSVGCSTSNRLNLNDERHNEESIVKARLRD